MTSTGEGSLVAVSHAPVLSGTQSIVAGVVAGCVTRSFTSPLDVLKIRIQVKPPHAMSPLPMSNVLTQTVRDLYYMDGLRGFWRGNWIGCCRLGPYAGAKFFLFDTLQSRFVDKTNPSNMQRAFCGATAGLLATMATYPLEVVRTRLIVQAPSTSSTSISGLTQGVKMIYQKEGIKGLYRGSGSGIAGAIPFEGVQFGAYEGLKLFAYQHRWPAFRWKNVNKHELDAVDFLVCGSVAGAVAQTAAYPFDTVKKRLQVDPVTRYRGNWDCMCQIVRYEGFPALYRGTLPNLMRVVPHAAVMFSTFEMTKKVLTTLFQ